MPGERLSQYGERYVGHLLVIQGGGSPPGPPLQPPGGGGTYDGMEARVARLEAAVDHIQADLADVKADVRNTNALLMQMVDRFARVEERLQHTPTTTAMVWGGLGLFVTLVLGFLGLALK